MKIKLLQVLLASASVDIFSGMNTKKDRHRQLFVLFYSLHVSLPDR